VTEVDLRVTSLLGEQPEPAPVLPPETTPATTADDETDEGHAATVALAVSGVTHLTSTLGRPVHIDDIPGGTALPRRHVRLEIAVHAEHRTADVAREVRARVSDALPDHPTVAVLVTAVS
jgi:hypothetical protein